MKLLQRVRRGLLPVLLPVTSGACTLVGYPVGTPSAAEAAGARAPRSVDGGDTTSRRSDAGRSYEVFGVEYRVLDSARGYAEEGWASWYGEEFHGRPTASGETFDMNGRSAAHRTLPLHTWIEVTNLENGRSLIVRVNDRGPFVQTDQRILDLSYGAARELGVVARGTARVRVRALDAAEAAELR